ncbi:MAG: hypothetical protein H6721_10800 [Sandaracinus sp.]|nr:hypothetical protein [Sandaracinus sp.]MCB9632608.1 hypothetical protein [Sandaracinus sp.]
MARLDLLRSLLRAGADRARDRLGDVAPLAAVQRMVAELRRQRLVLHERALTQVVAHVPGVRAATVTARHGAILVDVTYRDDETVSCRFFPESARFAPRGAKELVFRVEPPEALRRPRTREVAGALAGAIAQTLWSVALPKPESDDLSGAIVDRDGEEHVRVDLRTVPMVRRVQSKGPAGMVLELLELRGLEAEDGEVALLVKLPALG